jgi:hypothetical protein
VLASTSRKISSPQSLDQRPPAVRIATHQQQNAERRQMVWQFAIGTGVHVADEQSDSLFKIALIEIMDGSLLAPLDIFVARHIGYQGTIHFLAIPKSNFKKRR